MKYGILKDGGTNYIVTTDVDGSLVKIAQAFRPVDARTLVMVANESPLLPDGIDDGAIKRINDAVEQVLGQLTIRDYVRNVPVGTEEIAKRVVREITNGAS